MIPDCCPYISIMCKHIFSIECCYILKVFLFFNTTLMLSNNEKENNYLEFHKFAYYMRKEIGNDEFSMAEVVISYH